MYPKNIGLKDNRGETESFSNIPLRNSSKESIGLKVKFSKIFSKSHCVCLEINDKKETTAHANLKKKSYSKNPHIRT